LVLQSGHPTHLERELARLPLARRRSRGVTVWHETSLQRSERRVISAVLPTAYALRYSATLVGPLGELPGLVCPPWLTQWQARSLHRHFQTQGRGARPVVVLGIGHDPSV